ncbi:hypothetical protein BS78_07G075000 [Paspalum vaginatum]|nr:hypothetical protein BS78_07G075000 [Paspalum vaginatum]
MEEHPSQATVNEAFQSAPPIILPQPSDQHQIPPLEVPLQTFWSDKLSEIKHTTDFNFHSLPLRRIKKIMQTDEDVQRISDDALVFFAKACEMFIQDLTLRAWHHTKENKRDTAKL